MPLSFTLCCVFAVLVACGYFGGIGLFKRRLFAVLYALVAGVSVLAPTVHLSGLLLKPWPALVCATGAVLLKSGRRGAVAAVLCAVIAAVGLSTGANPWLLGGVAGVAAYAAGGSARAAAFALLAGFPTGELAAALCEMPFFEFGIGYAADAAAIGVVAVLALYYAVMAAKRLLTKKRGA